MKWVCGPPSDQDVKKYVDLLISCGEGALIVLFEPTSTVMEDGVVVGVSFTSTAERRRASRLAAAV